MEQAQQFHGVTAMGKRNSEWDLNNWKWDGDLFIASPLDHASPNSSSSFSDPNPKLEIEGRRARVLDRKRRAILIDDEEVETGTLSLNLGVNPNMEGTDCKKTKLAGGSANRAVCQVERCMVDLSNAKDYHRRHKVCETHSKVNKALVRSVMQRFCQQCSRFHVLDEFDDGKRSCRRRLAGHNKRRRKTLPDPAIEGKRANDDQADNYVLTSVMRLLSNMHTNSGSDPSINRNLAAHLLKSLASPSSGSVSLHDIPGLLHQSQKLLNGSTAEENSEKVSVFPSQTPTRPPKPLQAKDGGALNTQEMSCPKQDAVFSLGTKKLKSFDLNDVYIDTDDRVEDLERSPVTETCGSGSVDCQSWAQRDSQQSSPPQTSGNSGSASTQSPSSSTGEAQCRTDRIVFKLFGKEPGEFPTAMRRKVLDWLAHSPTDLESYIRPGCVVLTIYLRLPEPIWEELSSDLGSSLCRFFKIANESFWRTGWVYTRVKNRIAFTCNGQIVADTSFPSQNSDHSNMCVTPIAVSMSEVAMFRIKGSNLSRNSARLLCALEGKYLAHETRQDLETVGDSVVDDDEIKCVDLSCSIPSVSGRGFIEVEDQGLSSTFFPFIVTDKDVCSEIRMLESILDSTNNHETAGKLEAKHLAMDFIHEIGWLLHRCQLKSRLGRQDPNATLFSFKRFRWLMEFSMDHEWCAVVRKLLDVLLNGNVGYDVGVALADMGLVHRAVRRNSRALVETLLKYARARSSEELTEEFLFRPDVEGPAGLTPLHIAAGRDGSEAVLDALTDDPEKVGIEAWSSARDSTGATPEDYARLRGHFAYIRLVQRKRATTQPTGSVVIEVAEDSTTPGSSKHLDLAVSSLEITASEPRNPSQRCRACEMKLVYGAATRPRAYRPAMLSMVAVAAVCVCVALLFKSAPVVYILRPFRWESVDFGSI